MSRALVHRFSALTEVTGFSRLLAGDNEDVETGSWRIEAASGLRAVSFYFRGAGLIEIVCMYRDRREEFEFFASEVKEEDVSSTLILFVERILSLPKDALARETTIRDVLDYRDCKGIY
ncbi:hypothetical protein CMV30_05105 [Nibricoccus aquaticus]|uniref:Uncharacterized protein n=1 Tax=Nibricoccus aquaticus TaxID=2576891 RepID=A0A290Q885_9BACT|nr:hypothetical protein CMV30_05105 [Nibricoccus aquaticus]